MLNLVDLSVHDHNVFRCEIDFVPNYESTVNRMVWTRGRMLSDKFKKKKQQKYETVLWHQSKPFHT